MFLLDLVFVVILALLTTVAVAAAGGRRSSWQGLIWLFLVLLLGTWALGVWFRPIGPPVRGSPWGSFVVALVVLVLLLGAVYGPRRPRKVPRDRLRGVEIRPKTPVEQRTDQQQDAEAAATFWGAAFWAFLALAFVALLMHYIVVE